jgi:hypothetical protein
MKCLTPNEGETVVNGATHKYRYPCGKCDHCRRIRQQHYKLRLLLESLDHEHTSFVTFTYNDLHYNPFKSVKDIKHDAQKLIKRLRKLWYRRTGISIRYYIVHELGSRTGRSHYHAIIYGIPASEQQIFENAWRANTGTPRKPVYVSLGFVHVRDFTAARAGYVVKYSTKFLESPGDDDGTECKEFALMSRGSKRTGQRGIGLNHISRIIDSIKRAAAASKDTGNLSDYFESYVGSMRIGKSRMSIDPYLKKQIYDAIRDIERSEIEQEIAYRNEMGYDKEDVYMQSLREERVTELRRARRRSRNVPLTILEKITEFGERENAQTVAQRKQRQAKRLIKL